MYTSQNSIPMKPAPYLSPTKLMAQQAGISSAHAFGKTLWARDHFYFAFLTPIRLPFTTKFKLGKTKNSVFNSLNLKQTFHLYSRCGNIPYAIDGQRPLLNHILRHVVMVVQQGVIQRREMILGVLHVVGEGIVFEQELGGVKET